MQIGCLAFGNNRVGQAVAELEVFFAWMEHLSQDGIVARDEFFAAIEFSYKHFSAYFFQFFFKEVFGKFAYPLRGRFRAGNRPAFLP